MTDLSALKYTAEHEWVRIEGTVVTVGITAYAAQKLGDIVFVDLPKVGDRVTEGAVIGEIESTKSVGELCAPATGTVLEVNAVVEASPELVNTDPFGAGWLVRLECDVLPELLDNEAYAALTGQ
ncbi:MAG: glycine cleavage system protein GcvH [Rhodoglobus sp.]